MWNNISEFEVRVKGHNLIQVNDGEVKINGKNFHADLKNISALIDILSDVLHKAEETKKPRLVCSGAPAKIEGESHDKPFPYRVVG